jgi:hypothetical protein
VDSVETELGGSAGIPRGILLTRFRSATGAGSAAMGTCPPPATAPVFSLLALALQTERGLILLP